MARGEGSCPGVGLRVGLLAEVVATLKDAGMYCWQGAMVVPTGQTQPLLMTLRQLEAYSNLRVGAAHTVVGLSLRHGRTDEVPASLAEAEVPALAPEDTGAVALPRGGTACAVAWEAPKRAF